MTRTRARASSLPGECIVETARTMMRSPTTRDTAACISDGHMAWGIFTNR